MAENGSCVPVRGYSCVGVRFSSGRRLAGPIFFVDDEAGFSAAASIYSLTADGFEDLAGLGVVSTPLSRPGYSLDAPLFGSFQVEETGFVLEGGVSLGTTPHPGTQDTIVFTFDTPINAFSVLLGDLDLGTLGGEITISLDGGTPTVILGPSSGINRDPFVGVVDAMTAFTTLTLNETTTDPTDRHQIDFVQFGGSDPVPEPSTLLLLGTGLAVAAYRRRRKR